LEGKRRRKEFLLLYATRSLILTCGHSGTVTNKRATIQAQAVVTDITGHEDEYTLDSCGFQLCRHEARSRCHEDGYRDGDKVKAEYFPEMEQLLKDVCVFQTPPAE